MPDTYAAAPRPIDEEVFQRDGFRCVYCDFDGLTSKDGPTSKSITSSPGLWAAQMTPQTW